MKKSLFLFLLILSIDFYATKLKEMTEINSKYEQDEYLELFKIPNSIISSTQKLRDKTKLKKRLDLLKYVPFFTPIEEEVEENYLLFNFQKSSFIDKIVYLKNDMEIKEKCLRFGEINNLKFSHLYFLFQGIKIRIYFVLIVQYFYLSN